MVGPIDGAVRRRVCESERRGVGSSAVGKRQCCELGLKLAKEANAGKVRRQPQAPSARKLARRCRERGPTSRQSKVWDEVHASVAKSGVKPDDFSENETFLGNYTDEESAKRLVPYIEKLKDPVAGTAQVVGVVVAINGKVESLDAFESTPLFRKLWPKLLKSYALDAANAADPKRDKVACPSSAVCQFVDELQKTPAEEKQADKGKIAITSRSSERAGRLHGRSVSGRSRLGGRGCRRRPHVGLCQMMSKSSGQG